MIFADSNSNLSLDEMSYSLPYGIKPNSMFLPNIPKHKTPPLIEKWGLFQNIRPPLWLNGYSLGCFSSKCPCSLSH
ncbi:hypothetical protein D1BOALGB6SA_8736 [Olavius sp. associated proteobacterium Delta 1]|nr:hypothetical protein D1BOALGB6SA_8736 [Olavius sp. associated proteobacterium Delta 1]